MNEKFYFLLNPFTYLLIFGVAAFYFNQRKRKFIVGVVAFVFCFFSVPYIIYRAIHKREFSFKTIAETDFDLSKECNILVLGAGKNDDKRLHENQRLSQEALSRLVEAVKWSRRISNATLVCSGPIGEGDVSQAFLMKQTAIALGVQENRIVLLEQVINTKSEAEEYVKRFGTKTELILCTSAIHMPRALKWFNYYSVEFVHAAPASYIAPSESTQWIDWIPTIKSFGKWQIYLKEVVGESMVPNK
jgi:uncharacterized SAM-binding protein YcdF (DUF218 family)